MRIKSTLKKYYSNYEKSKQDQIDDYIEKGGNILGIFQEIEERFDFGIYSYSWYTPEDSKNREMDIRLFKVYSLLVEPKRIQDLQKVWIDAAFEDDPILVSYLYILANFRFNIAKRIRGHEDVSENGRWYLKDYEKYKEHIDTLYENTKDDSLKGQIQFCRYINEGRKESFEDLIQKSPQYAQKMTKKKDAFALIVYYLYKSGKTQEYTDADRAFIVAHEKLYILSNMVKSETREDFYIDEYKYMSSKFKMSELLIKEIATSMIRRAYDTKVSLEKIRFSREQSQEFMDVICSLEKAGDIADSLILYAVLIKQSEDKGKYVKDFDSKVKRLLTEENKTKNSPSIVEDIEAGRSEKDHTLYNHYFNNQRYDTQIIISCSMMFGMSDLAINYILFSFMYSNDYRVLEKYIYARGNEKEKIKELIEAGMDENKLLTRMERSYSFKGEIKSPYFEYLDSNIEKYKERLQTELEDSRYEMLFMKYYYEKEPKDLEVALNGLKNKYKSIQKISREYFMGRTEYNGELEKLLKGKLPKANKELVEYIVDYNKLQRMDMENISLDTIVEEFYNPKKMDKAIGKLEIDTLPEVKDENTGEEVSQNILKYYLATFLLSPKVELPLTAPIIKSRLKKEDLNQLGRYVYDKWFGLGAVAKMKMAMVFAVYNCDELFMMDFKKQIDEWTQNSRGAIASEGVKAMAFHGSDYALMQLDSISRKYKNKMVKKTAGEYFLIAAKNMGLTKEELADLIIPNLGFDANKELKLDYGSRTFTATLKKDLTIQLSNPDGKMIKTLPKPSKSDDEEIGKASKKHLTAVKKQLKTIVAAQKTRLERAIFIERRWDMETFKKVFVKNPIMNMFAVNLIWGKYDSQNKLVKSFRYMDDGTFADADYEEIELQEGEEFGLIHPMDLAEEELEMWKENLEDNEIIQPIKQLEIEIVQIDEEKMNNTLYDGFNGTKIPAISLVSKLEKQGWYKTSIVDGGGYDGLYIEFEELEYGAQIDAEYLYIGMGDESVTVKDLKFYKRGTIERGSYMYDDVNASNEAKLCQVEPKFLNAVISQIRAICTK
ncbi:MAG: DUF4132 domain-containing protein [Marinisporobacter sp.]|jgi:hypothetical protein|nr:DUF4132 domain-containing protein [Marinisporobacter sp.]